MSLLAGAMSRLTLGARPVPAFRAEQPLASVSVRPVVTRGNLVVVAAQNSIRRQRVSKRNTAYNKEHIELIKSSSRAVLKGYQAMLTDIAQVSAESDLKDVDTKMSKAFSNIDKAVSNGVMHKNTGARRKAKLTTVRKQVLAAAGLYTA